jgi:hypothetical protein
VRGWGRFPIKTVVNFDGGQLMRIVEFLYATPHMVEGKLPASLNNVSTQTCKSFADNVKKPGV